MGIGGFLRIMKIEYLQGCFFLIGSLSYDSLLQMYLYLIKKLVPEISFCAIYKNGILLFHNISE